MLNVWHFGSWQCTFGRAMCFLFESKDHNFKEIKHKQFGNIISCVVHSHLVPFRLFKLLKKKKNCFSCISQRRSQSTSVSRPPTGEKGADTTRVPAMLTGPHGTLTTSTTHIVNTPTMDTTTTRRSTTTKTRAAQGSRSTLTPQVGTFWPFGDDRSLEHEMQTLDLSRKLRYEPSAGDLKAICTADKGFIQLNPRANQGSLQLMLCTSRRPPVITNNKYNQINQYPQKNFLQILSLNQIFMPQFHLEKRCDCIMQAKAHRDFLKPETKTKKKLHISTHLGCVAKSFCSSNIHF